MYAIRGSSDGRGFVAGFATGLSAYGCWRLQLRRIARVITGIVGLVGLVGLVVCEEFGIVSSE
jgi:hypothetical protein